MLLLHQYTLATKEVNHFGKQPLGIAHEKGSSEALQKILLEAEREAETQQGLFGFLWK